MSRFKDAQFLKSIYRPIELEISEGEVAFIGRSNVGKSSMINAICGKKNLAITSATPGRTVTVNVFTVGKNKWIIDLPGYGFAMGPAGHRERLKTMIEGYLSNRSCLRLVILIVDGSVGATKLDEEMSKWLQRRDIPFIVAANKCDRIKKSELRNVHEKLSRAMGVLPENIRWVSVKEGYGMPALSSEIADLLEP